MVILLQEPNAIIVGAVEVSMGFGANASESITSAAPDLAVSAGTGFCDKTVETDSRRVHKVAAVNRFVFFMNLDIKVGMRQGKGLVLNDVGDKIVQRNRIQFVKSLKSDQIKPQK